MSPIVVACDTCCVRCCRKRDLFHRQAVYAWLNNGVAECPDYLPGFYHGVEGVIERNSWGRRAAV